MFLWEEAPNIMVYVQNMCPHIIVKDKTPKEAFTRVKPEARHLRIFGCLVYTRVPHEKRSKLDPSKHKGIFVGYSETSKGYRVYVLGHQQIDINKDVVFDEEATFKRSHESPAEEDAEEQEVPIPEEHDPNQDHEEIHMDPVPNPEPHREGNQKRPGWFRDTIQDVVGHSTP